ncbi:MAG: 30S ribosomal protein S11 [Patescibacteria group bacterium]|nr:30S ribosomal protein S11 [Patescibacteria group bacterium]
MEDTLPTTEETTEETTIAVEEKPKKPVKKAKGRKKKAVKIVCDGCAYIQATYNNTIVTLTDNNGNVLAWSSAGHVGFRGPKKATPYAASRIVKDVIEKTKDMGLKSVSVYVKGVGSGRDAAIRALNANNIQINSIKDVTPIPHNGCRKPRPRRI